MTIRPQVAVARAAPLAAHASPRRALRGRSLLHQLLPASRRGASCSAMRPAAAVGAAGSTPSWETLAGLLKAEQAKLGIPEPDLVNGPTNPHSLLRLFGSQGEPRVLFYRDHAGWCPYCEKIWLQLEEKRIPYKARARPQDRTLTCLYLPLLPRRPSLGLRLAPARMTCAPTRSYSGRCRLMHAHRRLALFVFAPPSLRLPLHTGCEEPLRRAAARTDAIRCDSPLSGMIWPDAARCGAMLSATI